MKYTFPNLIFSLTSGGGGGSLSPATADTLGGVKADPATESDTQPVRIGDDGKLVTEPYTLPAGTSAALGGAKFDQAVIGSTLQVGINADSQAVVPVASQQHLGVVTGKAKTTETGEVAVDSSGKMWAPKVTTKVKSVSVKLNALTPVSGTMAFTLATPGVVCSALQGVYQTPLILPIGDDDEWTLTIDQYDNQTASGVRTGASCVNADGAGVFAFPGTSDNATDISGSTVKSIYMATITRDSKFLNYLVPVTDTNPRTDLVNNHVVVQLRFKSGKFQVRYGTPSNYVGKGDVTFGDVTWTIGWTDFVAQAQAQASAFTAGADLTNESLKDTLRLQNGAEAIEFLSVGSYIYPQLYNFNGTIYSVTAKCDKGDGFPLALESKVSGADIRFLGSSVFHGIAAGGGIAGTLAILWGNDLIQSQCVSGTTLAIRDGHTDSYVERYENFTNKDMAEALVIQLSTNDFTLGCDLGEVSADSVTTLVESDGAGLDKTTTTGALEYIIAHAKHANSKVKIMVVGCPILSSWAYYGDYSDYMAGELKDLRDKWGFVVCDCFNQSTTISGFNSHIAAASVETTTWWTSGNSNTGPEMFANANHVNDWGYTSYFIPAIGSDLVRMFSD